MNETAKAKFEENVRHRAYALWESEGRPAGRDAEHWRMSEEAVRLEQDVSRAAAQSAAAAKPSAPAKGVAAADPAAQPKATAPLKAAATAKAPEPAKAAAKKAPKGKGGSAGTHVTH